ncbi:MAG: glycosyltransferase family 39 protein [Chloroflexota bacterium]
MSEVLARLLKRDWLLLALLLVVVTLIALPVLTYPLGRDQGEFATIGRGILNGRTPYTELWNPKPPAVFYIYALAMRLLGQTAMALRAIDFVVVPICCACIFWIGRRLINRRIGLWAALLFPVFYFTETFWTLTQNDGIVLVPMLLAMVFTLVVSDNIQVTSQRPNAIESQRHREHRGVRAACFLQLFSQEHCRATSSGTNIRLACLAYYWDSFICGCAGR